MEHAVALALPLAALVLAFGVLRMFFAMYERGDDGDGGDGMFVICGDALLPTTRRERSSTGGRVLYKTQ